MACKLLYPLPRGCPEVFIPAGRACLRQSGIIDIGQDESKILKYSTFAKDAPK